MNDKEQVESSTPNGVKNTLLVIILVVASCAVLVIGAYVGRSLNFL